MRSRHQKELRLFTDAVLLAFLAMDVLGPLPTKTSGNQHVVVWIYEYKKLNRAIPVPTISSTYEATVFVDNLGHAIRDFILSLTKKRAAFRVQVLCSNYCPSGT